MPDKPRVVVVGSSNTDMVIRSPRLPRPGESVVAGQFYMAAGGKGANQAVAAARAGARVTFVARLGTDVFGDQAIAGFQREGIDCRWVSRDPKTPSGIALILVAEDGENLISVALGANMRLTPADVARAARAIARADALVLQLEVPLPAVRRAVAIAHRSGVPVILNPAPAPRKPLPKPLLRQIDYLVLNETEMEAIAGSPVAASVPLAGRNRDGCGYTAARGLLDAGVRRVILTRGKQGAALLDGTPHPKLIPGHKVKAVDAVGAGDAFVGTFATFIAEGRTLDAALNLANAAAAISVTRKGAQPSMPARPEILRLAVTR
ncbi:MAG: ribokinase [Planctomycetes bacterium]|nr:ribokinase [Planctomycetota bacterium]